MSESVTLLPGRHQSLKYAHALGILRLFVLVVINNNVFFRHVNMDIEREFENIH